MKVMVPVETRSVKGSLCPSFGRSPLFVSYNTESGTYEFLTNRATESQGGAGIQTAQFLADSGAEALITYRCGENAAEVLKAAGIQILKAEDGSVEENITKYTAGELSSLSKLRTGHHGGTP